jgi:hypothetical protein
MREWWLRTLLVLQAPRPVFIALRDDSNDAAAERAEPVLLIILLAGMALALASNASHGYHGLLLPVWLFIAGSITGGAAYWIFGAILYFGGRWLGSLGSYRRARHVLAYGCVPLALALLLSPVGRSLFSWVFLVFVAWSAGLLVIGVRAVHGWTWGRAGIALAPTLAIAALLLAL